ncbi:MAG: hypothetical protein MW690_000259 [Methanophagales archaeon]|nr:hypothetical protein [Methanophagales archaeon]
MEGKRRQPRSEEKHYFCSMMEKIAVKDNSVDYVFTDPEYGESIPIMS